MNKKQFIFTIAGILLVPVLFLTIYFLFEPDEASKASAIKVEGVNVPIIMYHSILKDADKTGEFVITPEMLEKDILYLKEKGYTTVTISDLISYVYDDKPLPDKPIVLTFDDGYYNNMTYLFPLLQKHGCKAVVSVVGIYVDTFSKSKDLNPNYAYLTWDDIKKMSQSGLVEFQNHSYNMHKQVGRKGAKRKPAESREEYRDLLAKDINLLQTRLKENCNITPNAYTYPFGFISSESLDIIKKMGFKASLSSYEKPNFITKDPECLYLLNRYNRSGDESTEVFMKKIKAT